jgi:hypothetical protein
MFYQGVSTPAINFASQIAADFDARVAAALDRLAEVSP